MIDWLFRSRETGRITIVQFPNVALWIYIASVGLRRLAAADTAPRTAINVIGSAALVWWAVDEVLRGVNPWRRFLGVALCVLAAVGFVAAVR